MENKSNDDDWWVNRYEGLAGWSPKFCCPSILSAILCIPSFGMFNFIKVSENHEAVIKSWGKYLGKIQQPGCYYLNPIGSEVVVIDTRQQVLDLATVKVADHSGNPLVISGIVTYYIGESEKVVLNIENIRGFMETQSQSVIKQVVSKYPYESNDNKPSLKASHHLISEEMRDELQKKVDISGAVVISFELTDLSYAPEIANAMLVRQQAEATIAARNTIVKGAVMITNGAVESIESRGIKFSREEKAKLMGNLLITICGEARVQPVMKLDMPDFSGK